MCPLYIAPGLLFSFRFSFHFLTSRAPLGSTNSPRALAAAIHPAPVARPVAATAPPARGATVLIELSDDDDDNDDGDGDGNRGYGRPADQSLVCLGMCAFD